MRTDSRHVLTGHRFSSLLRCFVSATKTSSLCLSDIRVAIHIKQFRVFDTRSVCCSAFKRITRSYCSRFNGANILHTTCSEYQRCFLAFRLGCCLWALNNRFEGDAGVNTRKAKSPRTNVVALGVLLCLVLRRVFQFRSCFAELWAAPNVCRSSRDLLFGGGHI